MAQQAHRVYVPRIPSPGETARLPDRAARHLGRVLRLKPGAEVRLFDGSGNEALAVLTGTGRMLAARMVEIVRQESSPNPRITLAIGVSRGERMDWVIQKSVELGVHRIQPLLTQRTTVRLDQDRKDRKLGHWHGIMISACEQSGRCRLAEIAPVLEIEQWLATRPSGLVLSPTATQRPGELASPGEIINVLAGPEGGLAPEEERTATSAGLTPVKLGPRILRTETAPVAALAAVQLLWGDW